MCDEVTVQICDCAVIAEGVSGWSGRTIKMTNIFKRRCDGGILYTNEGHGHTPS